MPTPKKPAGYPKEVNGFYKKAGVKTARTFTGKKLAALIALPLLAIGISYYIHQHRNALQHENANEPARQQQVASGTVGAGMTDNRPAPVSAAARQPEKDVTVAQAAPATTANAHGHAQSSLTSAPAACIRSARKCDCYSQQGTKLNTPFATCMNIVKTGSFKGQKLDDGNQPLQSKPAQNYYGDATNSLRAHRLASLAMHGRDDRLGVFGSDYQSDFSSQSASRSGS